MNFETGLLAFFFLLFKRESMIFISILTIQLVEVPSNKKVIVHCNEFHLAAIKAIFILC